MDTELKITTYLLESSHDVAPIEQKMLQEINPSQVVTVHIAAYMHNTVMVHTLVALLQKIIPRVAVKHLSAQKNQPATLVIYECPSCMEHAEDFARTDALLFALYQENQAHKNLLLKSRHDVVQRYFTDPLTNLPNLYKLRDDTLESSEVTLIVFAVDNFKLVNDFYGFVVGDFLLEQLSLTLSSHAQEGTLYRLSGSEFILKIDRYIDYYELKSIMEQLTERLSHLSYQYNAIRIYLDLTLAAVAGHKIDHIFSKASMTLQHAKNMQLHYAIYEDHMRFEDAYETNLKISLNIRNAVKNSGVVPYFQPIIDNKTNKIVKYEALARLIDQEGTILGPKAFIPIAKKMKVYAHVTQTILLKSLETFKDSPFDVSINLCLDDIVNEEMYAFIFETLAKFREPKRVIFELIESEHIQDYHVVTRFINEVRRYGARIAIDEFGGRFSNFIYLTKTTVDYLKIDGGLIEAIEEDPSVRITIESIVAFAKKLSIKTIAVHVHSSTVLAKVQALGIDFSQGYHIDEPHPSIKNSRD